MISKTIKVDVLQKLSTNVHVVHAFCRHPYSQTRCQEARAYCPGAPASLMESGCRPFPSLHVCIQAKYPVVLFYFVSESASVELKGICPKTNKQTKKETKTTTKTDSTALK